MKGSKVYISGQITGKDIESARSDFQTAENNAFRNGAAHVVNPMKLPHDHDKSWASYMREDIKALCECDAIYMLPCFENSKGAKLELLIARELGFDVFFE